MPNQYDEPEDNPFPPDILITSTQVREWFGRYINRIYLKNDGDNSDAN